MSNSKSNTSVSHFIIDITNEQRVIEALEGILENDNDLTDNEDYFQEDTLELGYTSESDRIVKEFIKENGVPKTTTEFEKAFNEISESITDQDYFGHCEVDFLKVNETTLSVSFMIGGEEY